MRRNYNILSYAALGREQGQYGFPKVGAVLLGVFPISDAVCAAAAAAVAIG